MVGVSVIVPVYNTAEYLPKCLDSLLGQSLEEIEIILINDGSTDISQSIIDDYQTRFPQKICSIKKPNGGLSDARNAGLDVAKGQFIGFVDSDDFVDSEMFQKMYDLALKHHAEMVICNLQKVDQNGNVTQKLTQIPNLPEKIDLKNNLSLFSDISYFACNKIFQRNLFENARFKKGIHFEDIQLIPQLLLRCRTLAQTQEYYYQYLERTDSISKTHTTKGLDILNAVKDVENAFEKSDFKNNLSAIKNFQILEGVYTFLAYLAFVQDEDVYKKMSLSLKKFIQERKIEMKEVISYRRFGKNYLLSLPLKKKLYYLLYFAGQEGIIRRFIKNTNS